MALRVPEVERTWSLRDAEARLQEVDELLRHVARLVHDKQEATQRMDTLRATSSTPVEEPDSEAHEDYVHEVRAFQEAQTRLLAVLNSFFAQGIEVAEDGHADFLSRSGDTQVWLCYRQGEGGLHHWHDLGETCEARRAIPQSLA